MYPLGAYFLDRGYILSLLTSTSFSHIFCLVAVVIVVLAMSFRAFTDCRQIFVIEI